MNQEQLLECINSIEGLYVEKVTENRIYCVDDYTDRDLVYNVEGEMTPSELVHWGRFSGDKEVVLSTLNHIPKELLLSIEKIILLSSSEDFEELGELSPSHSFDFDNHVGMFVMYDNAVIVNLHLLEKLSIEEEQEYMALYEMDSDEVGCVFNRSNQVEREMWITLLHELRHAVQFDPLHEKKFNGLSVEDRETDAEQFAEDLLVKLYEEDKVTSFMKQG